MRCQNFVFASILGLVTLVAGDVQKWTDLSLKSRMNVISLDDQTFDQIITTERNYTTIVTLTALAAQYQCSMCREFDPEFATVAHSWRKAHPTLDGVFFAKLDFADGRPIFMRFGIQSAPNVWIYPPTSGPLSKLSPNNQPILYDFPGNGMNAEPLHKFLQTQIKLPEFPLVRPFQWQKLFITLSFLGATGLVAKLAWPQVKTIVSNKNTWAVVSLVTILMFTSGHMFNSIRHTPYTQPDGHGGFSYIAGGFQNQFGVETQIVASIYGLLAFTTIALALKAPTIRDPTSQSIAIWVWTAGILFIYSFLMYIFRIKNGGYPFKLFL